VDRRRKFKIIDLPKYCFHSDGRTTGPATQNARLPSCSLILGTNKSGCMFRAVSACDSNRPNPIYSAMRRANEYARGLCDVLSHSSCLQQSRMDLPVEPREDWPGCLALARWTGWSSGQVGRHVKRWSRSNSLPL